jgi:predicted nucleotidyltransferase
MRVLPMNIDQQQLEAFCRKHRVAVFSLFGSILREDFGNASDVDVLVSFEKGTTLTLDSYVEMREELQAFFGGREIDLVEMERLGDPYRRDEILKTREIIYGG